MFGYDPDTAMSVEWSDIRMAQVRIQRSAMERLAAELLGDDRGTTSIGFDLAAPVTPSKAVHWKKLMQYVTSDVAANPAVHGSPLVMRHVQRLVVATALETFPNSALSGTAVPAGPAAVRRAVAFIDEHAG